MLKTYLILIGAILCEVAGTMLLPVTQNFTKLIPTVFLAIFYLSAFYLMTFVVNKLKFFEIKDTISSFKCLFYIVLFAIQQKRIYNIQKNIE